MKKVTFSKDFDGNKKGSTLDVTDRHADILEKGGMIEKEDKKEKVTKEDKGDKKSK